MKNATAIRHVHFENLGSFEDVLEKRGFTVTYLDAGCDQLGDQVAQRSPQLLIILGGPIGAGERTIYPFLEEETALIQARLSREEPLLGVCLGAQLIAAALGSEVYPAEVKEIGWGDIELSAAGIASPLAELTTPVLHWHGDTFDLPAEAIHLASTSSCRNQAFAIGRHVLGLQFHAEIIGTAIEPWLIGHAYEIAHTPKVSVGGIRADTQRYARRLEEQSRTFFSRWLDEALS